ncbi:hypothetical protein RND71_036941 [Anisodus tanguticus]|uniref:Uncharacterized protein n=1 Tax=Anisodus tanguticus TaxID=243964 RepID=A0AAE1R524_9SOLA|nr:hypothetical protein RND71_036941 [Anisodus tanguticus]
MMAFTMSQGHNFSDIFNCGENNVEIIEDDQGNRITPSWVAFTDRERSIGKAAKNQAALNPERIYSVKRLTGSKFNDNVEVLSPEEICAMFLQKMKETAEAHLRKSINHDVVTVPVSSSEFNNQPEKRSALTTTDLSSASEEGEAIKGKRKLSTRLASLQDDLVEQQLAGEIKKEGDDHQCENVDEALGRHSHSIVEVMEESDELKMKA